MHRTSPLIFREVRQADLSAIAVLLSGDTVRFYQSFQAGHGGMKIVFAILVAPRLARRDQFRHDCHIMSHGYTPLMFVGAGLVLALLLWWIHQRY